LRKFESRLDTPLTDKEHSDESYSQQIRGAITFAPGSINQWRDELACTVLQRGNLRVSSCQASKERMPMNAAAKHQNNGYLIVTSLFISTRC